MAGLPVPDYRTGNPASLPEIGKPPDDTVNYRRVARNRNAFPTTLTDDSAMAAAAMIGDSRMPKLG